jgi:hypothetical protein
MTTYDDGGGTDLYAAGEFTFIGTLAVANFVARWNGSTWSSLDAGANDTIYRLTVFDDGGPDGPALYAGGRLTSAGVATVNHIAAWDGAAWSSPGGGVNNTVTALAVVNDGSGGKRGPASLYVGGLFHAAEDLAARHIARWDGGAWSNLGNGTGMNAAINAFAIFDDGAPAPGKGPALHAAGGFTAAGSALANNIAKWNSNDSTWSPLDAGTNFLCQALAVFNDGSSGDALFAGGWFTTAGDVPANYIAQWNGAQWSQAGTGVDYIVRALTVFDDALHAGGAFQSAGGAPAHFIARWDGTQWMPLSTGMNNAVYALADFDDGKGSSIYAGCEFTTAGGTPSNYIDKWDGAE